MTAASSGAFKPITMSGFCWQSSLAITRRSTPLATLAPQPPQRMVLSSGLVVTVLAKGLMLGGSR